MIKAKPGRWEIIDHGIHFRWLWADGRAVRCEAVLPSGERFVSHSVSKLIALLAMVVGDQSSGFMLQAMRLGGEACKRQQQLRKARGKA